ncbi:2-hydroxy-3-oxopropionate reductase [Lewinellaceae bacterium SD302]|nr:2-hydroxy-3-oxopropionate reductase [Lewinellaceae bacterium SD302]
MSTKITFVGLGIMGSRMAKHLITGGAEVTVYNRSVSATRPFQDMDCKVAMSVDAAVKEADVVITMLANPEAVESVMLGENGGLKHMQTNALWIDSSTVNPSFASRSAAEAKMAGIRFLDAPVAGSKPQAENKELLFFVGGEPEEVEQATPFFSLMGKKVLHIGETGKGASFKMLVNIMLAQSMIIFSEAILLGEKMGIDREFMLNLLPNTVVAAPFIKFKAESIRKDDYEVMFPLELMHKDLHLAGQTAYELDQPLFLAGLAEDLYARAKQEGLGRLDFAAIHRSLKSSKR